MKARSPILVKAALILPLLIFLVFLFLSLRRGTPGAWHAKCADFWQKRQWKELIALADNLCRLERQDPETLYFAFCAADQLNDRDAVQKFAALLLKENFLNRKIEKGLEEKFQPTSLQQKILHHRSKITLGLMACLILLQLYYCYPYQE